MGKYEVVSHKISKYFAFKTIEFQTKSKINIRGEWVELAIFFDEYDFNKSFVIKMRFFERLLSLLLIVSPQIFEIEVRLRH